VLDYRRRLLERVRRFLREEDAPTFMEYGLMITLVAIIVMVAVVVFGESVSVLFQDGVNAFP
jgi:Flp pilus assembly pilin Flp